MLQREWKQFMVLHCGELRELQIAVMEMYYVMSRLEHSVMTSQRNATGICRSGWCCSHICSVWFAAKADIHCCWFSSMHARMLYYAARESFNVFLCSLQSSHWAGDIHTSSHQEQQTAGGSQRTVHLPQYVPSCLKLNHRVSRIPHGYITLLCCGSMLKSTCSIKCYTSHLKQVIFKN